jgi:N-acetylmuramoyl-L-alanine amidase
MSCFVLRIGMLFLTLMAMLMPCKALAMSTTKTINNNLSSQQEERADIRIGLHQGYTRLVIELDSKKSIKTIFNESAQSLQVKIYNSKINIFNVSDTSSTKSPIEMLTNKNQDGSTTLSMMLKKNTQILRSFEISEEGKYRYVVDFAIPNTSDEFSEISQIIAMTEDDLNLSEIDNAKLSKTLIAKLDEEDVVAQSYKNNEFTDKQLDKTKPYKKTKKQDNKVTSVAYKNTKPVIVIDAGHGGEDAGAVSCKYKVKEKDITIRYAMLLYAKLKQLNKYDVRLTRRGDYFISLSKRLEIIQAYDADLFIAIHADSHGSKLTKGLSVYTLSEQASDEIAKELAINHEEGQVIGGIRFNQKDKVLSNLLISLERRRSSNESVRFADILTKQMIKSGIKTLYNTHRLAGFAVLKGPDVPSILLELGFLSNPSEEKLLLSKDHRHILTDAVVKSINEFMKNKGIN